MAMALWAVSVRNFSKSQCMINLSLRSETGTAFNVYAVHINHRAHASQAPKHAKQPLKPVLITSKSGSNMKTEGLPKQIRGICLLAGPRIITTRGASHQSSSLKTVKGEKQREVLIFGALHTHRAHVRVEMKHWNNVPPTLPFKILLNCASRRASLQVVRMT